MNGKGITLMAIAVVAIGTFALPNTVSLFSGQHAWYDLSGQGNDVPCEKCHADIAAEMDARDGPHTDETLGRFECEYCHRVFNLDDLGGMPSQNINPSIYSEYYITYASGDGTGAQPGVEAHAASTVPCMYCHSGEDVGGKSGHPRKYCNFCHHGFADNPECDGDPCGDWRDNYYHGDRFYTGTSNADPGECIKCHLLVPGTGMGGVNASYVPPAGGFNLTEYEADTGEMAAHKTFVMNAISEPMMEDANEACIACHTHIPVKINWKHAYNLEFNASYDEGVIFPPTHFNTSNYTANGTAANIESYGNHSGGANVSHWPSGDVTYWG